MAFIPLQSEVAMSKRVVLLWAVLVIGTLLFSACGGGEEPPPTATATSTSEENGGQDGTGDGGASEADILQIGAKVYAGQGQCALCHGANGAGIFGAGNDLLNSDFVKNASEDEVAALIREGVAADDPDNEIGVEMPANPDLSDEDVNALVKFLKAKQF